MSVNPGDQVSASVVNNAFVSKSADSTMTGKLTLNDTGEGDQVESVQQEINDIKANIVTVEGDVTTAQSTADGAVTSINNLFNPTTGHDHDGSYSKKVLATNLDGTGGSEGEVLSITGGVPAWSASAGGASSFVDLDDVPSAYTGYGNKIVKVKNDETGLEFSPATSGGYNYFSDSFGDSLTGWTKYNNTTAGAVPDNFGGTPTSDANLIMQLETSSPLIGASSLKFNKLAASNLQGHGYYYAFDLEAGHVHLPMKLRMLAKTSANYADADVRFYLVSSSDNFVADFNIIRMTPEELWGGQGFIQPMECQTDASDLKYRLCMHIASTSALAYDVVFDDYSFGPVNTVTGANIWKQYNLTVTGTNWTTTRAVGIPYKTIDGAWRLLFNIEGLVPNASRTSYDITLSGVSFKSGLQQSVSAVPSGAPIAARSTTEPSGVLNASHLTATTGGYLFSGDVELDSKPSWAADYSSSALSEDAGHRSLTFEGAGNAGQTITSAQDVPWVSIRDDASSWDGSGYIAQETGDYEFEGMLAQTNTGNDIAAYINGVIARYCHYENTTWTNSKPFRCKLKLLKGQRASFRVTNGVTVVNAPTRHWIWVNKLASPQQITASEVIRGYAYNTSGLSVPISTNVNVTNWTEVHDSHSCFNHTTGILTCPINGWLELDSQLAWNSYATTNTSRLQIHDITNGITYYFDELSPCDTMQGEISVPVVTGQQFRVIAYNNSAGKTLYVDNATGRKNHFKWKITN